MPPAKQWIQPLIAVLAVAYGLCRAVDLAWLCDDAFISFRYAQNLVAGHGLVFNVGEHVEGYTNFLWTLGIAGAMWAGLSPETTVQVLGVTCYVGTVCLLLAVSLRQRQLPVAGVALALHHHASSMASFGLETPLLSLLLTAALLTLINHRFLWAGILLTLATLTRPDGALPYAVACAVVLLQRRSGFWALVAPGILVGVPYVLWKLSYYGDILPNTFYAKSAADPYLGRGLWYVGLFFAYYPVLLVGLLAPAIWLWRQRSHEALWIVAFTLPYLVYVVWVGGDFMFARFCLPVTPALCLGLQLVVPALGALASRLAVLVVVAASLAAQLALADQDRRWVGPEHLQITEERNLYHPRAPELHRHLGRYLHQRLDAQEPVLAVGGAAAMVAYYCGWSTVIELHGLTDRTIARRPLRERGRVGHEKAISLTDPYLYDRGVDFVAQPFLGTFSKVGDRVPERLREVTFLAYDPGWKGGKVPYEIKLTMLTYDRRIMEPLVGAEDVRFEPFGRFLDDYLREIGKKSREQVRLDYAAFKRFYFDGNQDPRRQQAFAAFLR